ncbi:MAG: carboxymuconolactone decarboxylase family protein [Burkholderiaceae bacterium]
MSWIRTIAYADATGRLKTLYDRIKGPDNNVDNIMMAHSLRPHSMEGHMALYKYVLHHPANTLPKWFLELVGVLVSQLNQCQYCVEHHSAGLRRLLQDDSRYRALIDALPGMDDGTAEGGPNLMALADAGLNPKEVGLLDYAATLTREPGALSKAGVAQLRAAGADDGEILEVNQVSAYFAYANRTVLGLGINTEGDVLGLSPGGEDPDSWEHQ